jgi:LDH2 family malate/lactate/ureidoglycolate dehydrogenase
MDFATSQVATGKIMRALEMGESIPASWALNAQGHPVTTDHDLLDGGIQIPFGKHKGYAMGLLIELLCGAVTGVGCSTRPEQIVSRRGGNAFFVIAIDIVRFTSLETYYEAADGLLSRIKRVKPAPGFESVMIPGEPEAYQRTLRAKEGISVEDDVWEKLTSIASEQRLSITDVLRGE